MREAMQQETISAHEVNKNREYKRNRLIGKVTKTTYDSQPMKESRNPFALSHYQFLIYAHIQYKTSQQKPILAVINICMSLNEYLFELKENITNYLVF